MATDRAPQADATDRAPKAGVTDRAAQAGVTDRAPHAGAPQGQPRPASVVRAELTDLRRYLVETPPHHGAGVRDALAARIALLERELAATDE